MSDPIAHLDEATKHVIDVVSILTVVGTLVDMLPSFAAFLTVVWTLIRIYETATVQRLFKKPVEPQAPEVAGGAESSDVKTNAV